MKSKNFHNTISLFFLMITMFLAPIVSSNSPNSPSTSIIWILGSLFVSALLFFLFDKTPLKRESEDDNNVKIFSKPQEVSGAMVVGVAIILVGFISPMFASVFGNPIIALCIILAMVAFLGIIFLWYFHKRGRKNIPDLDEFSRLVNLQAGHFSGFVLVITMGFVVEINHFIYPIFTLYSSSMFLIGFIILWILSFFISLWYFYSNPKNL